MGHCSWRPPLSLPEIFLDPTGRIVEGKVDKELQTLPGGFVVVGKIDSIIRSLRRFHFVFVVLLEQVATPSGENSEKAGEAPEPSNGTSGTSITCTSREEDDTSPGNPLSSVARGSEQQPPVRNPEKVMVCLKRALKIAHAAQQQLTAALKTSDTQPVALFVEILNHYVYYYKQGLPSITSSVLQVSHSPITV